MIAFWIIAIGLAAAVVLVLARASMDAEAPEDGARKDVEIYKAQLAEVERDVARGVVNESEAKTLRTEIARRLLAADAAAHTGTAATRKTPIWATLIAGAAAVGLAVGVYMTVGAPGYGDMPLAARLDALANRAEERPSQAVAQRAFQATMERPAPDARHLSLVEELRAAIAERPDDLRGLALLARNEALLGNFDAAISAQESILAKKPALDASDHRNLAELMIVATGDYVSPEAEAQLLEALQKAPSDGASLYYLGLMHDQAGRPDRAFALWRPLLEESPTGSPWVPLIADQIPRVAEQAGIRYVLPEGRGPSAADIAAAQEMAPEDRAEMIAGMVEGLADRLATQGGPPEHWARLIAAQSVLGNNEEAQAILAEARQVFADRAEALTLFARVAASQGLE
ncbi:MAG: c-type cytochrome biogenesis protein CcmI [Rhodobacteraceae bacterium]|nr:c-type cytochrome biogenesis protein CcmI [Paracoccaceae bacterium]